MKTDWASAGARVDAPIAGPFRFLVEAGWDRVLIDATNPFTCKPRDIWGSEGVGKGVPQNFPPTTIPDISQIKQVNARWKELGSQHRRTSRSGASGSST